ncbi:MAG TPA: hypothetical protein VIY48_14975 [Candidatus Paceibacterota bacterium]|jgi:hypothetical protein
MTIWGNNQDTVPEGHCKDCEEEAPFHYENCPIFDQFKDTF